MLNYFARGRHINFEEPEVDSSGLNGGSHKDKSAS